MRQATTERKQQQKERSSMLAFKAIAKGTLKWKNSGKDDHSQKKGLNTPVGDKQLKQSLPPKPSHGVGKGLMTGKGPVTQGTVRRLLTHKDHVVEMVDSIIKETDLDPCADQTIDDLGASSIFDFSRVCSFQTCLYALFVCSFFYWCLDLGVGAYEGSLRQVCRSKGG